MDVDPHRTDPSLWWVSGFCFVFLIFLPQQFSCYVKCGHINDAEGARAAFEAFLRREILFSINLPKGLLHI